MSKHLSTATQTPPDHVPQTYQNISQAYSPQTFQKHPRKVNKACFTGVVELDRKSNVFRLGMFSRDFMIFIPVGSLARFPR